MDIRLQNSINKLVKNKSIKQIKTPSFVFDLSLLEENYNIIKGSIASGNCSIRYAMKANSDKSIINRLKSLGSGFEIASEGELSILKTQFINPDKIFYSSPVKMPRHISAAFSYGVTHYGFDSVDELEKIAKYAPRSIVYLRIHVSNLGASWKLDHKFGASKKDWIDLFQKAKELKLKPEGITFHVGWNNNKIKTWEVTLKVVQKLIKTLTHKGFVIKFIDLGGGFPAHRVNQIEMLESITSIINPILKKLIDTYNLRIFAEPGTFLVANCGFLLTQIYAKIKRGKIYWLYVDSSMTNGFYWILAGLHYEITPLDQKHKLENQILYNVTGPTCDSHETFQKKIRLSENLGVGDLLVISPAGAYISAAKEYNSIPYPKTSYI